MYNFIYIICISLYVTKYDQGKLCMAYALATTASSMLLNIVVLIGGCHTFFFTL